MIKNIVFDIGNVLTDYAWNEHIHKFGFSEEVCGRVAAATVQSPQWNEFDRGVLTTEEVVELLVNNDRALEAEIRTMLADISSLVKKLDYAIPWIQSLKAKGYGVYYLSNFSEKGETDCREALDFLPFMDGGILSYQDKLIKPQPEIYNLLLERYGLKAEESVFLDDTLVNVEAARHCGMEAIHFQSYDQAVKGLAELGVK